MTHAEISKILGISSERVRQIERTAIAKLMHPKNRGAWKNIKETIAMIETQKAKRAAEGTTGEMR
ncbi:sigma factor-like helix-turn-helix DNA-binding protein [Campylobacter sp. RM16191]|uniref:sigma factor-like helix-turn-helix DNA-binding protein n=1 Tax=Campylobacter sp. RM16191 TaxID=1705728 RepID=UPI001473045F|nr:sigma factor-like helix-turn-helix DNA-binding protein [Campylobacter sp. RM16191]